MGANGSFASGSTDSEIGRNWKTIGTIGDIPIIQLKNKTASNKLPEESHTANRTYVIFEKDGSDVKSIAKYGPNGKKVWEIHTNEHKGIKPHYHIWENGHPERIISERNKFKNVAHHLTKEMQELLTKIRDYEY